MVAAVVVAAVLTLSGESLTLRATPAGDVRERTVVTLTASTGAPAQLLAARRVWFETRAGATHPWRLVARCAALPCTAEATSRTPATLVYRATLRDSAGRVLRASRLVTITWRPA